MSSYLALSLLLVLAPAAPPLVPARPDPAPPAPDAPPTLSIPVAPATIEVQSTGEDPKVPLRPALRSGDTMSIEFEAEGLATRFGEGVPRQLERPLTVRWTLDMRVERVVEDGAATLAATVRDVSAQPHPSNPPAQVEQTKAAVDPLKGRTIHLDISAAGGLLAVRFPADAVPAASSAEAAPSAIRRFVECLSMLLRPQPRAPVGKGARWQVRSDSTVGGAQRIEVLTTTVEAVDQASVKAKLGTVIRPSRERASLPDERMPGNRLVSIAQLVGTGNGTVRWDGGRYLPVELREQVLTRLVLEGVAADSEVRRFVEEQDLVGVRAGR